MNESRYQGSAVNGVIQAAKKAAAQSQTTVLSAADEEELDPTQYFNNRVKFVENKRANGENPYPHKFHVSKTMNAFLQFSKEIPEGTAKEDEICTIAGQYTQRMIDGSVLVGTGRVFSIRTSGQKLRFYDVHSESQRLQVIANARQFEGSDEAFAELHGTVRRGDIVGVEGYPGYSNTGEFSMFAKKFVVLSPCLHMPPSVRYGLTEKVKHTAMVDRSPNQWMDDI